MDAIILTEAGGPEALLLQQVAAPELTHDDQVLVRIKAAGINPIDTKVRQAPSRFPVQEQAILGCDGAGIVEQVGSAVTEFKKGDAVYYCQCGFNGRQGNYAQYAVVDQCFLAHKPSSLSFEEAAAAPLVLITAWEALFDRVNLQSGQTVLIHAGAGGVGHIAVQLAVAIGARVITTVSSADKAGFVTKLGAEQTINYKTQNFVDAVYDWTRGQGVDVVFDTVGGGLIEQSFPATKVYGDLVTILQAPADVNWGVARKRNIRFTQELMLSPTLMELEEAKVHQGYILKQAAEMFDQGKLNVNVAKTFPLAEASEAHRYLEAEHPMGKVVLVVE